MTESNDRGAYGMPPPWAAVVGLVIASVIWTVTFVTPFLAFGRPLGWWQVVLATGSFVVWAAWLYSTYWRAPAVEARRVGAWRVVEPSRRRRLEIIGTATPGWILVLVLMQDGVWGGAALVAALVLAYVWATTRERLRFDGERLERRTRLGARSVRWADVTAVQVVPGGAVLWANGRRMTIWNQLLEGYPELAAEMLLRLPPHVLDASGGRTLLERQAAPARALAGRASREPDEASRPSVGDRVEDDRW